MSVRDKPMGDAERAEWAACVDRVTEGCTDLMKVTEKLKARVEEQMGVIAELRAELETEKRTWWRVLLSC